MLKVGDFSKLAHVTVKTLRHYDELGLLKPVWIDRYTSYRYYSLEQLPRLHRILALKDLGFSLAQVGAMLDEDLPASELRRMFDQKQAELKERLEDEQRRLARVAERLQQIEQQGCLPLHEVTLKSVPELSVAAMRLVMPSGTELERRLGRLRAELDGWTTAHGLRSRGQWLLLYPHPEFRERQVEVELALTVDEPGRTPPRSVQPSIQLRCLEAVESMACLLQPAGEAGLSPSLEAYPALFTWAESSGFFPSGSARELLLVDPAQEKGRCQFIEIQLPVESAGERKRKILERLKRKEENMEPKIVELPAFTVVGMRYYGKNENQEITGLWDAFNRRVPEIQHISKGSAAYGLCITVPEATDGEFEYVAGFRVDQAKDVPQEMVVRQVPALKYAVFTHTGDFAGLRETYNYIYKVWAQQPGHQLDGRLDFEYYDEDFKDFAPDSKFYIYAPIK